MEQTLQKRNIVFIFHSPYSWFSIRVELKVKCGSVLKWVAKLNTLVLNDIGVRRDS